MSQHLIPFFACARESKEIIDQASELFSAVLASGSINQGPWVEEFEESLISETGRKYAVAVGSATDGLFFALKSLGIGPGDEVLTTNLSFIATATSIVRTGATPVFCDIGSDWNLDLNFAARKIGPKTRAILFVHLFGGMTNPESVIKFSKKNKLFLIEDAAQAFGAKYGTALAGSMGDVSVFSFDPTKVLSAPGSGGAVLTNNDDIARRIRRLRNHGKEENSFVEPGYNSKLSSINAAICNLKLARQPEWRDRRQEIANKYNIVLEELGYETPRWDRSVNHAWHKYVFLAPKREALRKYLMEKGIPTAIHYQVPFNKEPIFSRFLQNKDDLKNTNRIASKTLSLPIHAHMTNKEIEHLINTLHQFDK